MSLNKKGFVLIETLSVTIFAATIFVFLFKSVVPIMGIYDTKIDQVGNIDAAYNNYHIRQMVYKDECFNNKCDGNYDAIKNIDYTMIRCDDYYYNEQDAPHNDDFKLSGSDKKLYSKLYSEDYCNKLLENIGAREPKSSDAGIQDHYWIFYVKGSKINEFLDKGLSSYNTYGKSKTFANKDYYSVYGSQFSKETLKLIKDTVLDFQDGKTGGTAFNENDNYLIFYYWYINPMYSVGTDINNNSSNTSSNKSIEPKYKDAINILTIKSSSENLYCFKFQVIPSSDNFYRKTNNSSGYYFYYDEKYTDTKKYLGDSMEKCMNEYNGKRETFRGVETVLGSTNVREYCEELRSNNSTSFYNKFSRDSQIECEEDMKTKPVSLNIVGGDGGRQDKLLNASERKAYCENLLKYHNQAYAIYQITNTFQSNCVHYFSSYDTIKVRSGNASDEGAVKCLNFTNVDKTDCIKITPQEFCSNRFNHYNLGTIWDDFVNARIGVRGFNITNNSELAIVDYDSNCSKDVVIPESAYNDMKITVIGSQAFKDKGIRSVKFNSSIKVIDKDAFAGNNFLNLKTPNGVLVVKY